MMSLFIRLQRSLCLQRLWGDRAVEMSDVENLSLCRQRFTSPILWKLATRQGM